MDVRILTSRDRKVAAQLAQLASDDQLTYRIAEGARRAKIGRTVWYEMAATRVSDGRQYPYWLAKDSGSFRGSFLDGFDL
ncbi:hypothetical protein SEA_KANDZ_50 [Mycobacterium phage KandZ]|uniref:Uncharacterized protein n=1 Tax=Mycobacterium phage KandZ TaxID=2419979 RepID=A0A3G2KGW6_9CAUD|nr:hypothetical protein SEA_KANDZ_50 [Mycobacterium phage KandZ]